MRLRTIDLMHSRKAILWLIGIIIWLSGFLSAKCFAGESTIVLQDNTRITKREVYTSPRMGQFEVETVEIKNPIAQHDCFDRIKNIRGVADRYTAIDNCLEEA